MRYFITSIIFVLMILPGQIVSQVDKVYTGTPDPTQKKEKKPWLSDDIKDKLLWGGNFQAWFGNPTFVYVSPTIGYCVTDQLQVGAGMIYNYTSYRTYSGSAKFSQSIFGGHSYARYLVSQSLFFQLQFDKLYQPDWFSSDPQAKRWVNYVFFGGGFRQSMGGNAALITSILYNMSPDPLSIYPRRLIVQFGFVGGF